MSRILRYETGSCVPNVLMMDSEDRTSDQHDAYSIAAVIPSTTINTTNNRINGAMRSAVADFRRSDIRNYLMLRNRIREEEMVDETDNEHEALLISKFAAVGIASETLADAADVAKRLCTQSGPVDGGTLDPRHYIDYQHLFLKLARKTSI